MKKLSLFFLFNINLLLIPLPSNAREDLGLSLDYDYFNCQNQLIASFFITDVQLEGSENYSYFNVSLGLRALNDKNPEYIYRLFFFKSDQLIPIINRNEDYPLAPGLPTYRFWNHLKGLTILNFDKTQIENSLIQWIQYRRGYGIITKKNFKSSGLNFDGFISAKIGLSSEVFGEYNFNNFENNSDNHFGLETGLNSLLDLSYKRNLFLKTELDYSLFITNMMINKFSFGFDFDYNYYLHSDEYEGYYNDYMKFSLGVNYNKYYFGSNNKEFVKFEFAINYFFYNVQNLPAILWLDKILFY